ncbi:hypothetical protein Zmor_012929 [Zophobas morio]|uniref:Uncharacterized protein n=1 Tax=Zophobas morio TaxID=2755281 RepID=A0AA38MEU9_9CUCU|nr:hypothetical protein Zmor_012929 [Zophobas morio]
MSARSSGFLHDFFVPAREPGRNLYCAKPQQNNVLCRLLGVAFGAISEMRVERSGLDLLNAGEMDLGVVFRSQLAAVGWGNNSGWKTNRT